MVSTAGLLQENLKGLERYFWGIARKNGGKAISNVHDIEARLHKKFTQLNLCFGVCSSRPSSTPTNKSAVSHVSPAVPSEVRAIPLHTSRTCSGLSVIYDLGDASAVGCCGTEWQHDNRSAYNNGTIYLKPGMRGRHIFGPTAQHPGKCFEWVIHQDKARCGLPVYVVKEFELDGSGFRQSKQSIRAHSPNELWDKVYTDVLHMSAPHRGTHLCGFQDPSLADLTVVHSAGSKEFELKPSETLDSKTARWERSFAQAASGAFRQAMKSVCRSDPALAFEVLCRSAAWQAEWCDPDDGYDDIIDMPFITGMVSAFKHAPKECQIGILSLFAPHFPVRVTCGLFGVKQWEVTEAKLHDADAKAGQPALKAVLDRMRLSPRMFAFLHGAKANGNGG